MTIYLSLLLAVVGAMVYALSNNPKMQELGRITYGCGLLAFLLRFGEEALRVLKG